MGNCLFSSTRVDSSQSHHATSASGGSRVSSKTSRSSAPSSLTIPSFSDTSSTGCLPTPRTEGEILSSPNLKPFSFNELKSATRNFRPDSLLGEGGFGYVFKGWLDENTLAATKPGSGMVVAVKKLKPEGFQGHKEWLTEVDYLGQLHHPNLVKLIGYCSEGENRLLVYEFMPKGSLENHLFRRGPQPLSWAVRLKVAIGAARGLSFLHDLKSQVIYRDFKASNILLDGEFNSKLSDFGLAKAGPTGDRTHVSTQVMGTHGYAAPEYVATGRLTAKSDVYSFGVVLLELLSGRRVVDNTKVGVEQNLVDWAKPYLGDKRKLFRIMDTRLGGQYPQKSAYTAATLALQCLSSESKLRPKMSEVLAALEQLEAPKTASKHTQSDQQSIPLPVRKPPMRQAAKKHLTQRIQNLDDKMETQKQISKSIQASVEDARMNLSNIEYDLDVLQRMISGLDGKIGSLEYKQDLANAGVWYLCNMVGGKKANMPEALQEQLKLSGKSRALLASGTPTPKGLKDFADILSGSKKDSGRDAIVKDGIDNLDEEPRSLHRSISARC